MGVDTRMRVKLGRKPTQEELRKWSHRLAGAFYCEPFFFHKPDSYCLEVSEDEEHTIEVTFYGRYYGPGYERGDLPTILMVAEWLELHTGGQVYYGGDTDAPEDHELFDKTAREKLKAHFLQHGHYPYQSCFGLGVLCPRCKEPMLDVGGGGGDKFNSCYGCPNKAITRAGRILKLWDDKESFFKVHQEMEVTS